MPRTLESTAFLSDDDRSKAVESEALLQPDEEYNDSPDAAGLSASPPTDVVRTSSVDPEPRLHPRNVRQLSLSPAPYRAPAAPPKPAKDAPVTWSSLPHKRQLFVLALARLAEPLTQTSIQSYLFKQLQSYDPSLPPSSIAARAGLVQACLPAAQACTAVLWGRAADSPRVGRKIVLLIGLCGTAMGMLGYGLAKDWKTAIFWRALGGALNGNAPILRTMISEIVKEKKYQSRAFLLMPMCFNIGTIIGPPLGGLLADPAGSYPSLFGSIAWMLEYPFALPNFLNAFLLLCSASNVLFMLDETHEALRDRPDIGVRIRRLLVSCFKRLSGSRSHDYTAASVSGEFSPLDHDLEVQTPASAGTPRTPSKAIKKYKAKLPFRRIWTRNVLFMQLCHVFLGLGLGTFNNLWFIFLATPRFHSSHPRPPNHHSQQLPFSFTGGLGLSPPSVGFAMAILGSIGITMQIFLYPYVSNKLGTLRSYRIALLCFPVSYFLTPYLALVPSSTAPPLPANGAFVWLALGMVLIVQVLGRTFANPANMILINNSCPHPSVLATVHSVASSVGNTARTVGPLAGGWLLSRGLSLGAVGLPYWILSGVAICGCFASSLIREGDGHEIWLEGDVEEGEGKPLENGAVDEESNRRARVLSVEHEDASRGRR